MTISTGKADDAILIPNAAISFTPDVQPSEIERLYREFKIPDAAHTSHRDNQQVVWKLASGERLTPVAIKAGLSDSNVTQLVAGNVAPGDVVVTGNLGGPSAPSQQGRAPIPNRPAGGRR